MAKKKGTKLQELFDQSYDLVQEIFKQVGAILIALAEGDENRMGDLVISITRLEKIQDKLSDKITAGLYGKDTMTFSREDRLFMIEGIENLGDYCKLIAMYIDIYRPTLDDNFRKTLRYIGEDIPKLGEALSKMLKEIEVNLDGVRDITQDIIDYKRKLKYEHWNGLKKLYNMEIDFKSFNYLLRLMKNILLLIDKTKDFSDNLGRIAFKYRL